MNFLNKANRKLERLNESLKRKAEKLETENQRRKLFAGKQKQREIKDRKEYISKVESELRRAELRKEIKKRFERQQIPRHIAILRALQNRRISELQRRQFLNAQLQRQNFNDAPWLEGDFEARRLESELRGIRGVANDGDRMAFSTMPEISNFANLGEFPALDIDREILSHGFDVNVKPAKRVSKQAWDFSNLLP